MERRIPQTRYAASGDAHIAYRVVGNGAPDLLMIPGFVSHLEAQWQQPAYRRFCRELARGSRLIQFDKRGTGLSDPTDGLPSVEERVEDVSAVMKAARSRRVVLFGLSDGARAAIAVAASHPERALGLILYGCSYRGPRPPMLRTYRSMLRHWGEGRIVDLFAPSIAGPEARLAAGAFERAAASPAMAKMLVESLGLMDVRDRMAAVTVPTLVLHREGDVVPVADARKVAEGIPGATLTLLTGQDHLPWIGDSESVVREVLSFVDRVAPVDRSRPGSPSRPRPARSLVGWSSLTDAERPVVQLVVEGRKNSEIAECLFLSRYTVETHLKHVYTKLGIGSRSELAALAASREQK